MLDWLKRILVWLWKAKLLWLALAVLLSCLLYSFFGCYPESNESRIRIMGLILQLGGVITIFISVLEVRKLFNHPGLLEIARKWWKSFPPYHMPKAATTLQTHIGAFMMGSTGTILLQKPSPNATIEERVFILETNRDSFEQKISELNKQYTQINSRVTDDILTGGLKREREIVELEGKLEATETGGEYLSLIGLFWLFIGLIMSAASVEISQLF